MPQQETVFVSVDSPPTIYIIRKSAIQKQNFTSPAGNRTPVARVTGGDTNHYTTEDA